MAMGDILLPQYYPHTLPVAGCTAQPLTEGWEDGQLSGCPSCCVPTPFLSLPAHPATPLSLFPASCRGWSWRNLSVSPSAAVSTPQGLAGCWGHRGCCAGEMPLTAAGGSLSRAFVNPGRCGLENFSSEARSLFRWLPRKFALQWLRGKMVFSK